VSEGGGREGGRMGGGGQELSETSYAKAFPFEQKVISFLKDKRERARRRRGGKEPGRRHYRQACLRGLRDRCMKMSW
jgi:hypothetical protein